MKNEIEVINTHPGHYVFRGWGHISIKTNEGTLTAPHSTYLPLSDGETRGLPWRDVLRVLVEFAGADAVIAELTPKSKPKKVKPVVVDAPKPTTNMEVFEEAVRQGIIVRKGVNYKLGDLTLGRSKVRSAAAYAELGGDA